MRNPILFLLPIFMFISTTIIAQEVIKDSVKSNQIYSPQATGDNVKFLDEDTNELLKVIDEGDFGSLELKSGVPPTTTNKLYNGGGDLFWGNTQLGLSEESGWVKTGNKVTLSTLTDYVGIGNTNPIVNLDITSSTIDDASLIKLSNTDNSHNLFFYSGHSTNLPYISFRDGDALRFSKYDGTINELMRITSDGNLGIGVSDPGSKLEVNGKIKITGGTPGVKKVLTSDNEGLASWEENNSNPQIGFSARLSSNFYPANGQDVRLSNFFEKFDDGNGFDPLNGTYIIPSTGTYQFIVKINWGTDTNVNDVPIYIRIYKNGIIDQQLYDKLDITTAYPDGSFMSILIKANISDQINFYVHYYHSSAILRLSGGGSSAASTVSGLKIY